MKRVITLFFLTLLFISVFSQENFKAGVIAFYNVENVFDTINTEGVLDEEFTPDGPNMWTGKRYLEKLDRLATVIAGIGSDEGIPGGPAILGVSEIENRSVLEDLAAHPRLADADYKVIHFDSPDRRGVDVGLLYQPRYFEPLNAVSAALLLYNDDGSRIYTRDQLLVSGNFDGELMHFIVNHWPSRRGGEKASRPLRNEAARLTKSLTDSLMVIDPDSKIVIMGDLNDDPVNQSVKRILGAVDSPSKVREGGLFNAMYPLFKKGVGSLAYRDAWNLFDQLIVSEPLLRSGQDGYRFLTARVYNKEFLTQQDGQYRGYPFRTYVGSTYQGGYSDHFPVYIILVKPVD
ncbi:MAG: endonuclease/exonuclease/phosphatase family protein [Bacteroidales bacterium]|nr:endonuclease/exonuclease/phosphatase family protein [Bacteroidales bacterium]